MAMEERVYYLGVSPDFVSGRRSIKTTRCKKAEGVTYNEDDRDANNDGEQDVYSKSDGDRSPQRRIHLTALILMFLPSL